GALEQQGAVGARLVQAEPQRHKGRDDLGFGHGLSSLFPRSGSRGNRLVGRGPTAAKNSRDLRDTSVISARTLDRPGADRRTSTRTALREGSEETARMNIAK